VINQFMNKLATKAAVLAGAVVLGVGSAYFGMANLGNRPVPENIGWTLRSGKPNDSALPYVLGHYLASGQLPPPLAVQDFHRDRDEESEILTGSCVVEISGSIPEARWWTLSAVNSSGTAPEDRNTLTAGNAILEPDDTLVVHISTSPQTGNWIKPPSNGTYGIALAVHEIAEAGRAPLKLPRVKRIGC
jgi:hypothetical protein